MVEKNKLYFGDNLKILREYVPDASVDLIYLDPPFNSSATYNVLFKEKSGDHPLVPSLLRRGNRGGWRPPGLESEALYKEIVTSGPRKLADLMQALLAAPRMKSAWLIRGIPNLGSPAPHGRRCDNALGPGGGLASATLSRLTGGKRKAPTGAWINLEAVSSSTDARPLSRKK